MPERAANRGSLTKTVAEKHESQNSVQLKTFTRWANSYLEPRGEPVTDLVAQVNSGVLFFRLLEALEVLPVAPVARGKFSAFGYKVISAPTLKLQRLENLNSFLLVLAGQKSLSLVNIGAEDLEGGNVDLILGVMWAIIQHYELGLGANFALSVDSSSLDSAALLRWVREQVPDAKLNSTIGWASGFRDGEVLCGLVARSRPDVLDRKEVERLGAEDKLKKCFDKAEAELDVPQLLDAHELASGSVDQISLVTYVAKVRNALLDTGLAARKRAEAIPRSLVRIPTSMKRSMKTVGGAKNGSTRTIVVNAEAKFYPADDVDPLRSTGKTGRRDLAREAKSANSAKLRKSITPGTVLILLAGRFRGRRVVFLKQMRSTGLLLVSGPYGINGIPLRRVNQAYCIATSTTVDVSGVDTKKFTDEYFGKGKQPKRVKKDGDAMMDDAAKAPTGPSDERKKDQAAVDASLLKVVKKVPMMDKYLKARFSLSKGDKPHQMLF